MVTHPTKSKASKIFDIKLTLLTCGQLLRKEIASLLCALWSLGLFMCSPVGDLFAALGALESGSSLEKETLKEFKVAERAS